MKISPTEAVRQFDVSKPTLYKDMSEGTISFTLDSKKRRQIDTAELARVYNAKPEQDNSPDVKDRKAPSNSAKPMENTDGIEKEQLFEELKKQYEKRIEQLESQVDDQRKMLEAEKREKVLLIEDRTQKKNGAGEWEKSMQAIESRISNVEKDSKKWEQRARQQLQKNKDMEEKRHKLEETLKEKEAALKAEKEKSFLQKLFG